MISETKPPETPISGAANPVARRLAAGLAAAGVLAAATLAATQAQAAEWLEYRNPHYGTLLPYPDFLQPSGDATDEMAKFRSEDGAVTLEIASTARSDMRIDEYFRGMKEQARTEGVDLDYLRRTDRFAVVSGENESKIIYARCNFYRSVVTCFNLRYPTAEKRAFDPIVTRMSLNMKVVAPESEVNQSD